MLIGRGGADDISGGEGNDALRGDAGADTLAGGEGVDWVQYHTSGSGVTVDLTEVAGFQAASGGDAEGDVLSGFERVLGSDFADVLRGDVRANMLIGRGGADDISGGEGNDVLRGDAGADTLAGGDGDDLVQAGGGNDEVVYTVAQNLCAADRYTGGTGQDRLTLQLTRAEWIMAEVQTDIAAYLDFIERETGPTGDASSAVFAFDAFGLRASEFENLRVLVDGTERDPRDQNVLAADDVASLTEDDPATDFPSVLVNDDGLDPVHALRLISGPAEGVLVFNEGTPGAPDGTFRFDPAGAFDDLPEGGSRDVFFVYEAITADGNPDRATVTITVTGANDAPVVTSPDAEAEGLVSEAGLSFFGDASAGVVVGSGALTSRDDDTGASAIWSGDAQGQYGSFAIDPTSGVWTYTLDNTRVATQALAGGRYGTETFTATVTDDRGATDTQQVTVIVSGTNDAPVARADTNTGAALVEQGFDIPAQALATGQLLSNDSDVDAGNILFVSKVDSGTGEPGSLVGVPLVADLQQTVLGRYGSLLVTPEGAWEYQLDDLDPDTDALGSGDVATETFTYTLSDGTNGQSTAALTLQISGSFDNALPVAVDDAFTVNTGQTRLIDLLSNDTDADIPPAGGTQVLSVASVNGQAATEGAVIFSQAGMLRIGEGGSVSYTPTSYYYFEQSGADVFSYVVTDGLEESTAARVIVTLNDTGTTDAREGFVSDGYVLRATVFADANGNGVEDADEDSAYTSNFGAFSLKSTLADSSERLVSVGGIDISTGIKIETPFRTPAGATAITPLSTLFTFLEDEGLTRSEAALLISSEFALDPVVDFLNDNPVKGTLDGDAGAAHYMASIVALQGLVTQIASAVSPVSADTFAEISNDVFAALANHMADATKTTSIFSETALKTIIKEVAEETEAHASVVEDLSTFSADFIARFTGLAFGAVEVGATGEDLLVDLAQVGIVTQGWAASELADTAYSLEFVFDGHASAGAGEDVYVPVVTRSNEPSAVKWGVDGIGSQIDAAESHVLNVRGGNSDPVALGLSVSGDEDTDLVGDLPVSDIDRDSFTIAVTTGPAHGTVDVPDIPPAFYNPFSYSPDPNFFGTDSFTYTVTDVWGASATETVTLTVNAVNDVPIGEAITLSGDEGAVITGTLSASDIENHDFVFSFFTRPTNGTVTVSLEGEVEYRPNRDFSGTDSFVYQVLDSEGGKGYETVTLTVNALPDAPVLDAIPETTLSETLDTSDITTSISVNFTDPDLPEVGHTATVTYTGASGAVAGLTLNDAALRGLVFQSDVTKDAGSTGGFLGLVFSAPSPVFDYLSDGETVTLSYEITIDDTQGGQDSEAFDITITGTDGPLDVGIEAISLADVALSSDQRGFVIKGAANTPMAGFSVSDAGDVNGDGLDDLIIGAPSVGAGASFVVFGKTDAAEVSLSQIQQTTHQGGFVINGISGGDFAGWSVSSAGDVNGDGLDDLIVGAPQDGRTWFPRGSGSGESYVIFGKTDGAAVDLSDIRDSGNTDGFVIDGVSELDFAGTSVSAAGDVNGDGRDDLIVGAYGFDPSGDRPHIVDEFGASYVVYGKADGQAVNLSAIQNSSNAAGFVINGVWKGFSGGYQSGKSVSSAGDVNGDGLDDLIIGAPYDGLISGSSFVVFGKKDGIAIPLTDIQAGIGGFVISGVSDGDQSGSSVSSAGDVNGDGFDDLIVGAPGADPNGQSSGMSTVVFGKADGGAVNLSQIQSSGNAGGFAISGANAFDTSGRSVSSAGDVNGDGLDDLIIGASGDQTNGDFSGASFVVFGKTDGQTVLLSNIKAGLGGFMIDGVEAYGLAGYSVSAAGDVNGDGFDDLIVGAPSDVPFNGVRDWGGSGSGNSFVVFGGDFSEAATQIGTILDDTLAGTAAIDVLIGGIGDDTLVGNGGADVLRAGAGDDVIAVSDLTFAKIDGGNGLDTLRLDGTGLNLDLSVIAGSALQEIESINLNGGGNTVKLDKLEVLGISGETNILRLFGDASDTVKLDGTGWLPLGSVTDAEGSFEVFTDGLARVQIAAGVTIEGGTAPIELSALALSDDHSGFVINGISGGDRTGWSVSSAGDVNGDGLDDLLVGAPGDDTNGSNSGASYVVFGKIGGGAVDLSDIAAGNGGYVITGISSADPSGDAVSAAGDVNGDGLDDLIIGRSRADDNGLDAGSSVVVFGKTDGLPIALDDVSQWFNTGGFVINGVSAGDRFGASVSAAGDVNGDGMDDLIIGASKDDPNGESSGTSYVVFGKTTGTAVNVISVERDADLRGFVINGVSTGDNSGWSVSSAGDVNGDGFDDLIVGAPFDDPNGALSGASFVVFGKADGDAINLSVVQNSANNSGFVINGVAAGNQAGISVSSAGDVNGDGLDDLIVGAHGDEPNGAYSGASFVVFGKADGIAVNLSDVQQSSNNSGFVINGAGEHDRSGWSVSSAGDINGDGLDDLIVGALAEAANGTLTGASYVVFGKADGAEVSLYAISQSANSSGFVINGASEYDQSGTSVSSAGDVNGDGFDDLIIGAPNQAYSSNPGASFVVFGGDFTSAATQIGTVFDDTLTGNLANDVLIGGTGADTLIGNGGADVLRAGAGDDVIAIRDLGFATIDGGNGLDTLRLGGTGLSLDLATTGPSLQEVERIDLNGGGNSVRLNKQELLGISGETNTLRVLGDATDTVRLSDSSWIEAGQVTDAEGTFDVFTNGLARIEIDEDITRVGGPVDLVGLSKIDLSDLVSPGDLRGFVINGIGAGEQAGWSVSSAGDVNDDGFDDVIIGAPYVTSSKSFYDAEIGTSFVVFGSADAVTVELSDIRAGIGGFAIDGAYFNAQYPITGGTFPTHVGSNAGYSVSAAGDFNGDGFADLLIGAPYFDPVELGPLSAATGGVPNLVGGSFVVLGKTNGLPVTLEDVKDFGYGTYITAATPEDGLGRSVSAAGDVNGDGFDDLIVGAPFGGSNGADSGTSYVVFGRSGGNLNLTGVEAGNAGFSIKGAGSGDQSGYSVSAAGDVNGDGFDDVIIGAPFATHASQQVGASYVVFGKADSDTVDLSEVEASFNTEGFAIFGVEDYDNAGFSVSAAGDVNGDGLGDLIVGAPKADVNGAADAGASYVVFGKTDGAAVNLTDVKAGTGGFLIDGASSGAKAGFSVSSAGDFNGDGRDDLLIGAPVAGPNGASSGASYVVFGKSDGTSVDLSELDTVGGLGVVINGVGANDRSGASVSSAGDMNGDGFDDLIIGAAGDDTNAVDAGASFVVFGGDFTGAATQIGTTADDNLVGSTAVDVLIGGTRNDTLVGNGGADVLRAGEGDDLIAIGDAGFAQVDGGNGTDTLRVTGTNQILDLTSNAGANVQEIERIDLNGGANSLTIDSLDLLGLSGEINTLRVLGGATDIVRLAEGLWTVDETITDAEGTFNVWTDGRARIEVADALTVFGGPIAPIELSEVALSTDIRGFVIKGEAGEDRLGWSVSGAGDVNGDGFDDVIVGAPWSFVPLANGSGRNYPIGQSYVVFGKEDGVEIDLNDIKAGTGGFVINGMNELVSAYVPGYWISLDEEEDSPYSFSDFLDDVGNGAENFATIFENGLKKDYPFLFDDPTVTEIDWQTITIDGNRIFIPGVQEDTVTSLHTGWSVSGAGDVNGDGLADLIVGAPFDTTLAGGHADGSPRTGNETGATYIVFGKKDGAPVNLYTVGQDGIGGFAIEGVNQIYQTTSTINGTLLTTQSLSHFGLSVSSAGDINGDGFDDLIIGAPKDSTSNGYNGSSVVIFGKPDGDLVKLSEIKAGTSTDGFVIAGSNSGDRMGYSVSGAGDINGDGLDDMIIGAQYADLDEGGPFDVQQGKSYVVFGTLDVAPVDVSEIENGTGGFVINGADPGDRSGFSVSDAGDVNGDGLDDVIVGAHQAFSDGGLGASYVVFGKTDGTAVDLSDIAQGTGGFAIDGVSFADPTAIGVSVSSAGDVNGDGFDDLIIGAPRDATNGTDAGASYVVFGKANGTAVDLGHIEDNIGATGFKILGVSAEDHTGRSVSSAGDINGDGFADLIVGAPHWLTQPSFTLYDFSVGGDGASFVIFGGNFTGAATHVGTNGKDVMSGTVGDEAIFAGAQDDIITGNGGADRLSGGEGDDTFVFTRSGGTATVIDFEDGEGGQDMLDVSAFGFADFAAIFAQAGTTGPGARDVLIQLDADNAVVLKDVDLANLDATDFVL